MNLSFSFFRKIAKKKKKKKRRGGGGGGGWCVGIRYVPVPNKGYGFYEGLTPNRVSFLPLLALFS